MQPLIDPVILCGHGVITKLGQQVLIVTQVELWIKYARV